MIFGASGDLARRKLLPALYHLYLEERLPERFATVGYARTPYPNEEFRESAYEAVKRCAEEGVCAVRGGTNDFLRSRPFGGW